MPFPKKDWIYVNPSFSCADVSSAMNTEKQYSAASQVKMLNPPLQAQLDTQPKDNLLYQTENLYLECHCRD